MRTNEPPSNARPDVPWDYAGWLAEKRAHNEKRDAEMVAAFDKVKAPGIENDPEFAYTAFTWFAAGWGARANAMQPSARPAQPAGTELNADGRPTTDEQQEVKGRAAASPVGEQDAVDAARYRWLRESGNASVRICSTGKYPTYRFLDAAIDAAIHERGGKLTQEKK